MQKTKRVLAKDNFLITFDQRKFYFGNLLGLGGRLQS